LRQVFQRAFDVLALAAIGAALLVVVAAPAFAALLGAPPAARPMRVLALALPSMFVSLGFTHLLLAEGRQTWLVRLYAVLVAVNVGANLIAIRNWSYAGAAAVTAGTETLSLVCLAAYWLGRRRWRLQLRVLWAVPVAAVLAWLGDRVATSSELAQASGAARLIGLVALSSVTAALFAGCVLGLRLLPPGTLRALWPGGRRGGGA
jgi:O-antigen/teichoic acid export membrane protein